jgi:hypothetical protein
MNVDFGTFSGNICFEFSVLCPLGVVNELIRVLKKFAEGRLRANLYYSMAS